MAAMLWAHALIAQKRQDRLRTHATRRAGGCCAPWTPSLAHLESIAATGRSYAQPPARRAASWLPKRLCRSHSKPGSSCANSRGRVAGVRITRAMDGARL